MKSLQQHLNEALNNQPVIYDEKNHLITYPMARQEGWEEWCEQNNYKDKDFISHTAITFNYSDDTIMVETPMGPKQMNVFIFKCKNHLMDYYKKSTVNMQPNDLKATSRYKNENEYYWQTHLMEAICWTFNNAPEPLFDEPVK